MIETIGSDVVLGIAVSNHPHDVREGIWMVLIPKSSAIILDVNDRRSREAWTYVSINIPIPSNLSTQNDFSMKYSPLSRRIGTRSTHSRSQTQVQIGHGVM